MKSLSMKPLVTLILLVCAFSQLTVANPVTWQQAQQNALAFLAEHGKSVTASSLRSTSMHFTATGLFEPLYLFNIGDNQGYVIASGDDCAPAILGYADSGSVDVNNMPENMRWWLDEYARQIQFMRDNGLKYSCSRGRLASMPAIPPLLTTGWDQYAPYSGFTPLDPNGNHYVTGCVATAMAQVLYYHRANSVSQTTHEMSDYVTPDGLYVGAIPAGSFIDWDNILDSYWHVNATEEQMDAVAWLMRYCGSSVHMQYAVGGSSARTHNVAPAMIAYFNYGSRAQAKSRDDSGLSDEEWENLVYSELSNSRPLVYSGTNPSHSSHAFVCDGYDGEGFFHINWGWGKTQGYYLLTAMDSVGTSLLKYHVNHQAIFYAQPRQNLPSPDAGMHFTDPIVRAVCLQVGDVNDDGILTMEEFLAINEIENFYYSCVSSFDEFQLFTGIPYVSDRMFAGCENMKSIILPDQITSIGKSAFFGCRRLKELTLPCPVTVLKAQAFSGCDSLQHLIWNARNCGLEFMATLPSNLKRLTIGDSTVMIPNSLAKDSKINKLTLGKSVVRIGMSAFRGCTGLKSVVIPNSVTTIAKQAFAECSGLNELTLGNSVSMIDDRAFENCSNLMRVTIPNAVSSIGLYAFRGCANLRSVVIGKSVTAIKSSAFAGCNSLRIVNCLLPSPLSINENVFKDLYANAVLRVPADAVEDYRETFPWSQFADIIALEPSSGDVDLDGVTNINDVTALIDQILKGNKDEFGDVDGNGLVNIDDVTALIDKLLHQ